MGVYELTMLGDLYIIWIFLIWILLKMYIFAWIFIIKGEEKLILLDFYVEDVLLPGPFLATVAKNGRPFSELFVTTCNFDCPTNICQVFCKSVLCHGCVSGHFSSFFSMVPFIWQTINNMKPRKTTVGN